MDRWLKALGVEQADEGCQLDVEQLKGQYARAHIKTDDGSEYPSVIDVQPLRPQDVEKLNARAAAKAVPATNVVATATTVTLAPVIKPAVAAPVVTIPVAPAVTAPVVVAPVSTPSAPRIRAIPF